MTTTTTSDMMTLDEAIAYAMARDVGALDGRDRLRLSSFVPGDRLHEIGFELKAEDDDDWEVTPWTVENVVAQLELDVAFGFEKALGQRGISASLMHTTVCMWNRILRNDITDAYPYYGLPTLRATAIRYGFPNPIGDDTGSEVKYNAS